MRSACQCSTAPPLHQPWGSLPQDHPPLLGIVAGGSGRLRPEQRDPQHEADFIRKILWINFGLDMLYILGGVWMILSWRRDFWQGTGWGIVFQGAFLFLFDLYHALNVPVEVL